ncbi:MAG: hypothetical protein JWL59_2472 [Chthoniobacteraceae bacterium]|nr:hypothetical protein [Chthoniobacteraceae bacterium]
MPALAIPTRQILLSFRAAIAPAGAEPPETDEEKSKETFRGSLSAIEFADGGRTLFLGGDETVEASPSLERLVQEQGARFGGQISQRVDAFLDLPSNTVKKGRVQEIDIEGLAFEGETLWMVGSHSLKRSKPKLSKNLAKNLDRLATVEAEGNRFFLASIPVGKDGLGRSVLPANKLNKPLPARLADEEGESILMNALRKDRHLGPFLQSWSNPVNGEPTILGIPSKDNGFDIEGLAVDGDRLFLGLRGPVIGKYAIVLEIAVTAGAEAGELKLRLVTDTSYYIKHFVNLRGLGIRDLCKDGDDLLLLAGPTMALDGPSSIFRWSGILATSSKGDSLTDETSGLLERRLDLPCGEGCDHPEGMALLPRQQGQPREIVIVYDSPGPLRRVGATDVWADVFLLT